MAIGYVLYNPKAGKTNNIEDIRQLETLLELPLEYADVLQITDYRAFLSTLAEDDVIVLAGGDGTLNRFANNVDGIDFPNEVLYFPNGTGNDFAHDLGKEKGAAPFPVKQYLQKLPTVTVKGKDYRFINGIGYGIDGYCCEVGDQLKEAQKKVDYTAIAIKGLLFHYKPTNAKITVDGQEHTFKKVWLAPTMNGRFYGGGMMPTPDQSRDANETLSTMVFHGSGKLKTLMIFPSLFKGEHVKHTKHVSILSGKQITVEFDRPVALQIDGETFLEVSGYTACAPANVLENILQPV